MKKISSLCLLLLSSATSYAVQTCPAYIPNATPSSRYTVDTAASTVTDNQTGLMWQQCSVGQTAASGSCTGSGTTTNWQGALQAGQDSAVGGHTDWRLPNNKELSSIVAFNCINPSVNLSVFPNTPSSSFWSSSPDANLSGRAWRVYFDYGSGSTGTRSNNYYVRLVR
jgi:hypothetical protein